MMYETATDEWLEKRIARLAADLDACRAELERRARD